MVIWNFILQYIYKYRKHKDTVSVYIYIDTCILAFGCVYVYICIYIYVDTDRYILEIKEI